MGKRILSEGLPGFCKMVEEEGRKEGDGLKSALLNQNIWDKTKTANAELNA